MTLNTRIQGETIKITRNRDSIYSNYGYMMVMHTNRNQQLKWQMYKNMLEGEGQTNLPILATILSNLLDIHVSSRGILLTAIA